MGIENSFFPLLYLNKKWCNLQYVVSENLKKLSIIVKKFSDISSFLQKSAKLKKHSMGLEPNRNQTGKKTCFISRVGKIYRYLWYEASKSYLLYVNMYFTDKCGSRELNVEGLQMQKWNTQNSKSRWEKWSHLSSYLVSSQSSGHENIKNGFLFCIFCLCQQNFNHCLGKMFKCT